MFCGGRGEESAQVTCVVRGNPRGPSPMSKGGGKSLEKFRANSLELTGVLQHR